MPILETSTEDTMTEPELKATKLREWVMVPVDEDGVPLSHGDRMTEIEPGVWMHPVWVALMDYLATAMREVTP